MSSVSILYYLATGEEETSAAIKRILDSAKERNKKLARVTVTVSERGVAVTSQAQPVSVITSSGRQPQYCTSSACAGTDLVVINKTTRDKNG